MIDGLSGGSGTDGRLTGMNTILNFRLAFIFSLLSHQYLTPAENMLSETHNI